MSCREWNDCQARTQVDRAPVVTMGKELVEGHGSMALWVQKWKPLPNRLFPTTRVAEF